MGRRTSRRLAATSRPWRRQLCSVCDGPVNTYHAKDPFSFFTKDLHRIARTMPNLNNLQCRLLHLTHSKQLWQLRVTFPLLLCTALFFTYTPWAYYSPRIFSTEVRKSLLKDVQFISNRTVVVLWGLNVNNIKNHWSTTTVPFPTHRLYKIHLINLSSFATRILLVPQLKLVQFASVLLVLPPHPPTCSRRFTTFVTRRRLRNPLA